MAERSTWRELVGMGRGRVLLFCWLGWVFDFYDLVLFVFVKGAIAADLGLGLKTDIPLILGLTLGATALGGFLFGRLADLRGRRFAITWSILLYSAGAFATAFAQDYWTLLLARLVTGLGVGGEWGVGHAIVAETYPSRLRGRAAGILQAGSPIAMGLAAAMACFSGLDWRTLFLLAGAPALLACFARWAMPGEDRSPGRGSGALGDLFRAPLRRASVPILALLVLHMSGFWCMYSWLPNHLMAAEQVTPAFVGWFFVGVNSLHVVADVLFGFVADRFGRKRIFAAFCVLFSAGLLVLAWGYEALRADLLLFCAAFALVGLGAGTWSCFGVLFAQNYPERLRATAASGFYNLARGSQLATQPLMGWLLVVTDTFAVALVVGALTSLLSALVIWSVPETEPQPAAR